MRGMRSPIKAQPMTGSRVNELRSEAGTADRYKKSYLVMSKDLVTTTGMG